MIYFYQYRKVKIELSSLVCSLMRILAIPHLGLVSELHHAVVAVGPLDIQYEIVLINNYIFN